MFPIAAMLFVTAYAVRTAKGTVLYIFIGMMYFFIVLFRWASLGGASAFPLGLMVSPAFLPPLAYAYFAKRRRLSGWVSVIILTALSAMLVLLYFAFSLRPSGVYGIICYLFPSLVIAIALLTAAVTRRMENTPWFIMIPLSVLTALSLLMGDGFISSSGSIRSLFVYLLSEIVSGYQFWFMVSVVITYQALSHKSYFRNIGIDFSSSESASVKEDPSTEPFFPEGYREEPSQPRRSSVDPADFRTAYPPRVSRFGGREEKPEREDRDERDERNARHDDESGRCRRRDDYSEDDRRYREDAAERRRYRDSYDDYGYDDYRDRPDRGYDDREGRCRRYRDDPYYDDRRYIDDDDRPRRRRIRYDEDDDRYRRPVRDLDYEDDPRSRYDKWYDLIRGDGAEDPDRRRR